MKRYFKLEILIFLTIWALLMMIGPTRLFRDPGTFSHTKIGEQILLSGNWPHTDTYSFTFGGQPWIAQQWLGECIMALIHGITGFDGLLLATATILAFLFAWLAHRLSRSGLHFMLVTLIISLALSASALHLHIRPHIVSILFMAFIFSRLTDFESGRINLSGLLWLIPIFILWTNIHGGVLGGLGTLTLMIGGWTLAKIWKRESPIHDRRQMFTVWGLLFLCLSTAFINPYGSTLPKTWFSIMTSSAISSVIQEHSSVFSGPDNWVIFLFGSFYLFSFLGTFPKWPRTSWLIPLVWLALSLSRIRHAPLFAVSAAVALGDLFPHIRWAKWLANKGSQVFRLNPIPEGLRFSFRHGIVPVSLIVLALLLQLASVRIPVLGREWVKIDPNYWPVELHSQFQFIEENYPEGTPIFNDFILGGFLMYYAPHLKVFIDDRCELYGDRALLAYALADCSTFENWADTYGFQLALTTSESALDHCLRRSRAWSAVTKTIPATLYRKGDARPFVTHGDGYGNGRP